MLSYQSNQSHAPHWHGQGPSYFSQEQTWNCAFHRLSSVTPLSGMQHDQSGMPSLQAGRQRWQGSLHHFWQAWGRSYWLFCLSRPGVHGSSWQRSWTRGASGMCCRLTRWGPVALFSLAIAVVKWLILACLLAQVCWSELTLYVCFAGLLIGAGGWRRCWNKQ